MQSALVIYRRLLPNMAETARFPATLFAVLAGRPSTSRDHFRPSPVPLGTDIFVIGALTSSIPTRTFVGLLYRFCTCFLCRRPIIFSPVFFSPYGAIISSRLIIIRPRLILLSYRS